MKLTPQSIKSELRRATTSGRRIEVADDEVRGLVLRIGIGGTDALPSERDDRRRGMWSVRVVLPDGKRTRIPLGSYAEVSIADARKSAKVAKEKARMGELLSTSDRREAARAVDRSRTSIRALLDTYEQQRLSKLRSGALTRRSIEILLEEELDREPSCLTRSRFASLLDKRAKNAPIAANRSLAYTRPFLKWMVARGYLEDNPTFGIEKPTREIARERTLTRDEIIEIWQAATRIPYPFGQYFQLMLLIACRRNEIAEMKLGELDLENAKGAVWTLPSIRSKSGRSHRIPLSVEARDVLLNAIRSRPVVAEGSSFVFTTTGTTPISGWAKAKAKLDEEIAAGRSRAAQLKGEVVEDMEHWTFHDIRRGFATVAVDILHADPVVVDRCLNHVGAGTTSVVARVYQRSEMFDQRRDLLAAWGKLIVGTASGVSNPNNVIAFLKPSP